MKGSPTWEETYNARAERGFYRCKCGGQFKTQRELAAHQLVCENRPRKDLPTIYEGSEP